MSACSSSRLAGKVALVTGGSLGIGASICRAFAREGARVAVNARHADRIEETVAAIWSAGGCAQGVPGDCTDPDALAQIRERVETELGPVDILVANAGGLRGAPCLTTELPVDQWRAEIDLNLTGTFLTVQAFLPGMMERRGGSIITISSTAGRVPSRATAAYAAAKAGVVMLTRQVATEAASHGVRVNCIAPGAILTEGGGLSRAPEAVRQQVAAAHPLGRVGVPEDVSEAALYLASDASSWITGITLDVAGGRVML